ncbi:MAG: hypothetical protein QNJ98_18190 [Planctomycetota bacterium]|nr:hypothetical protein [Planctomycetota bacterium]
MKTCLVLLLASLSLLLAACGGGSGDAVPPEDGQNAPVVFVEHVNHTYFPLEHGMRWVLEGTHEGLPRREEVRVLDDKRRIDNTDCVAVLEEVFDDGVLSEITTEWFAQDQDGNVWKFGEESFELDGGSFVRSDDSWFAGQDGFQRWRAFVASPNPGDTFFGFTPEGQDVLQVVSVTETVVVPGGTFAGSMQIVENPDDPEDTDIILYARGVGRVSETNTDGGVELISVER